MHKKIVLALLVLQCTLCLSIRVPVDWNDESEVKYEQSVVNEEKEQTPQPPIYNEYFKYTANKPQFAIDSATTYGFQSPESHYKSHPVRPHTGLTKPVLGQHQILNSEKDTYLPYQKFLQNSVEASYVTPVSTSFEVYHPYKVEQPALEEIYKDPVLDKIRNDLRNSKNRLQKYENEAGEADISKDEYLESPAKAERKKIPHKNAPVPYEIHRPQRRPIYYRPPVRVNYREQVLNHKLRHPWNQNIAKVTPYHYRPIKNHLHSLRQHHALKYDDEQNEYPQVPLPEKYGEVPDGYDIYEKGKAKYVKLRNNVDESINKAVQENRPYDKYKLELQNGHNNDHKNYGQEDEEEFVPIKNYAQVRKIETTKHLPRTAALSDAESFEELQNAPRLREAIKSTKAQIVYSEEGYEDAAYDHAGEHKHASDHEGHGGYLKENEISGGKYQTPYVSTSYDDAKGSKYREQLLDGKKWKDSKKENEDEVESDDYSEEDGEHDLSDVIVDDLNLDNDSDRNKRNSVTSEDAETSDSVSDNDEKENLEDDYEEKEDISQHDVIKRETSFKVPEFDFNSTLPSNAEIVKLSKAKVDPQKLVLEDNSHDKIKYPYYYQNIKTLNKNSPLRYAENIDFIPKKSSGGTEFYDSRSNLECSEVEENIDAVPDKLKKGGHPDETGESSDKNTDAKKADEKKFDTLKNNQRLKGLGDKIDCFKAKYFGENPLDSPFFKEDIIESPEPITKPNLKVFKPKKIADNTKDKLHYYDADIFSVLDKIHNINNNLRTPVNNVSLVTDIISSNNTDLNTQSRLFTNILNVTNNRLQEKIKSLENAFMESNNRLENLGSNLTSGVSNLTYKYFENKEQITKPPLTSRKKRAAPFTYEPYKIIRDSQVQDSKKTTTTGNISPLIKQLQSSKIIDKVTSNLDKDHNIKSNAKPYKDIGKLDRKKTNEQINDSIEATFVNVNSDKRRSEPRFELRPANHKDTYTPVENKQAISVEEYKTQTRNKTDSDNSTKHIQATTQAYPKRTRSTRTTSRPFFDVSKYLPQTIESQSIAASNAVEKVVRTPQVSNEQKLRRKVEEKADDDDDDVEQYDEYEDDDENHEEEVDTTITTTTTSTTTRRPSTRKKTRGTTTIKTTTVENETEPPKLRLTTRFRNPSTTTKTRTHHEVIKDPVPKVYIETDSPKYTEKKRKSTKSMLVTDTKTYGDDDDDDMTRKEVDARLRVKQDMKEYMPLYEKENNKQSSGTTNKQKNDDESVDSDIDDIDEAETENDGDDDDDDDEDEDNEDVEDDDSDIEEDDDENENSNDSNHKNEKQHLEITTSEPTKRTLARTTVAPATTTESRSARIELKPVIVKKKFEVHEETPVNQPSPHVTHFKQDIKEIEIVKKIEPKSREKIHKNVQALDLYRDENLAEEINKLGDVEVFKENLNLKEGPKHGGNYRSVTPENIQKEMETSKQREVRTKGDVEPSPTQPRKRIKLDSQVTSKHQNPSSSSRSNNNAKSAKLIELSEPEEISPKKMHGGNLKYARNKGARQNDKNEKFIELDESEEDETSEMHGGNFETLAENSNGGRQLHGGNYKSAKIVTPEETTSKPRSRTKNRDARTNAAVLLNSYARVVPILTTTPAYILDPSKRMYYYVDD